MLAGGLVSLFLHGLFMVLLLCLALPRVTGSSPLELGWVASDAHQALTVLDLTLPVPGAHVPRALATADVPTELAIEVTSPISETIGGPEEPAAAGGLFGQRGASFFGTRASGDRFVYIVDISASMGDGQGRRLKRAMAELSRSIARLEDHQSFYVMLFAQWTRHMFDNYSPAPQMLPATTQNKERLLKWTETIHPDGGTYPQDALRVAMEMRPDAVFFLSDGTFSAAAGVNASGQTASELIADGSTWAYVMLGPSEVVKRTNSARVPIHSIAFEDPESSKCMSEISELTGGEFRFVAAPAHSDE